MIFAKTLQNYEASQACMWAATTSKLYTAHVYKEQARKDISTLHANVPSFSISEHVLDEQN